MNRTGTISALTLILATLALPATASAAEGWARSSGTLRAGPSSDYPAITRVVRGEALDVFGCVRGRTWCDISVDGDRGWFPGGNIELLGSARRIRVTDPAAAMLGLSILSFGMTDYWRNHYEDRRFYRDDRTWRRFGARPPSSGEMRPDRPPGPRFDGRRPSDAPVMRPHREPAGRDFAPIGRPEAAPQRPPRAEAPPRPPRREMAPAGRPEAAPRRAEPAAPQTRPQPPRPEPSGPAGGLGPIGGCTDPAGCR
jgi:uncharacterized protein YraI